MKSPPPGCNGVEGCKWIPKIGCLDDNDKTIQYEMDKKNIKIVSQKNNKSCKTFKKNKPPKCNDQEGCKWIEKQGKKPGYCSNL